MRFASLLQRAPKPNVEELFIRNKFEEAIAFSRDAWIGYRNYIIHVDPTIVRDRKLSQLVDGFVFGPIYGDLVEQFGDIRDLAEDMRLKAGVVGGESILVRGIIAEGLIEAGEKRHEVRAIFGQKVSPQDG